MDVFSESLFFLVFSGVIYTKISGICSDDFCLNIDFSVFFSGVIYTNISGFFSDDF